MEGPRDSSGPTATPLQLRSIDTCERLADDFVSAFNERDASALQRLNAQYGRWFDHDDLWAEVWRRIYAFRQRAFRDEKKVVTRD